MFATLASCFLLFTECYAIVSLQCDKTILELDADAFRDDWDIALAISGEEIDIYESIEHKIASFFQNNIVRKNSSVDVAVRTSDGREDDMFVVLQTGIGADMMAKCMIFEPGGKLWLIYAWKKHSTSKRFIANGRKFDQSETSSGSDLEPANCTNGQYNNPIGLVITKTRKFLPCVDFAMAKLSLDLSRLFGGTWRAFVLPDREAFRVEFSPFNLSCVSWDDAETVVYVWNVDPRFAAIAAQRSVSVRVLTPAEGRSERRTTCEYEANQLTLLAVLLGITIALLIVIFGRVLVLAIMRR